MLTTMRDDLRERLYVEFERLMTQSNLCKNGGGSDAWGPLEDRALALFYLRRDLRRFLDAKIATVEVGAQPFNTEARNAMQAELMNVKDTWSNADGRTDADKVFMDDIFNHAIRPLLVGDAIGTQGNCVACHNNISELVLLPCSHACICQVCYNRITLHWSTRRKKCPVCRVDVMNTEPFTVSQLRTLRTPGGQARHSGGGLIILAADAGRGFRPEF